MKDRRRRRSVLHLVKARFFFIREIDLQIVISQEFPSWKALRSWPPVPYRPQCESPEPFPYVCRACRFLQFLSLHRMIADLWSLNDRLINPVRNYIRSDDHFTAPSWRRVWFTAKHEPSVVVVHSSVVKLRRRSAIQWWAHRKDRRGARWILYPLHKAEHDIVGYNRTIPFPIRWFILPKASSHRDNCRCADSWRRSKQRRIRLLRKDAALIVHNPRFAKKRARKNSRLKPTFTKESIGNRTIQINGHPRYFSLYFLPLLYNWDWVLDKSSDWIRWDGAKNQDSTKDVVIVLPSALRINCFGTGCHCPGVASRRMSPFVATRWPFIMIQTPPWWPSG